MRHTVVALSDAVYLLTLGGASQSRDLRASKLNFVEVYRLTFENSVKRRFNFEQCTFYEVG